MRIAVSRVTTLIGQNFFCDPEYGWRGMMTTVPRNAHVMRVEALLDETEIYQQYMKAEAVTRNIKQAAAKKIKEIAKACGLTRRIPKYYFAKKRGTYREPILLERMGVGAHSFQKEIELPWITDEGHDLVIHGKVDALDEDGNVIEVKCRSSKFYRYREGELTQLALYCYILKCSGRLVIECSDGTKIRQMYLEEATERAEEALSELGDFVDQKLANKR